MPLCVAVASTLLDLYARGSKDPVDCHCCSVHCVARGETGSRPRGHAASFVRGQIEPSVQKPLRAFQCIVVDQAHVVARYIRPDVHLVADEHWASNCKSFHN